MTYNLTYQIKGIEGQFVMPIRQEDTVKYVSTLIKKEFGIIPKLTARIYGSELQSTSILSQCVRSQDVVTFDCKETPECKLKLEFYRQPLIIPRYQSNTTFIVFTTINFESMIIGNKINVDIGTDTASKIISKIKDMFKNKYKSSINDTKLKSMNILLFLPGGIPFLEGTISKFIESFPDFMPHLYAIIYYDKNIKDEMLDEIFDSICDLKNSKIKTLISPDYDSEIDGLCEIAAVLGYIQHNGQSIKRMIYSIAKFCPFSPMINGLYNLSCLSRITGRTILQITAPLLQLFDHMSNIFSDRSNLFKYTVKFLTYFMNIKITDRVPCTEFIRPFYSIGYEKYFYEVFTDKSKFGKIQSVIAFDPDFRDQDWIRFELPNLKEEDFENAMEHTKTLDIIPALSLREMHRVSLFRGSNGPWLFLAASVSKEETEKDKIDYINPENGIVEHDTYENIAKLSISGKNVKASDVYDGEVDDLIDPEKVTQLVIIVIDKSGSMRSSYGNGLTRFQACQKFFIKFTEACYKFHTTSLYGSIMFTTSIEVRNKLNPLASDFSEKMIKEGEKPGGGTHMFTAMKCAADLLLAANCIDESTGKRKFPNAELREIVISDGNDGCHAPEMAKVSNFLLKNHIRIDAIIVSRQVAKELVYISRNSGGFAFYPRSVDEGFELFNKEEFFDINLRQFGPFHDPNITEEKINGLHPLTIDDLDKEISTKPNIYADKSKVVTSPQFAVSEFEKARHEEIEKGVFVHQIHVNVKRIIFELKKVMSNPDEDIKVFPLKDRVDVWRVLIRGLSGSEISQYEGKWFYMIIEFTAEYPQHYPLFRFVYPPFHPNITDKGRVCMETLDKKYRSDMSILELLQEVKILLMDPNYDSCVDMVRAQLKGNIPAIKQKVKEWNDKNGKNSPDDWEKEWNIQPDDNKLYTDDYSKVSIVPEEYLCPITRKIMKEPVKATSGVYYEKSSLENYLKITPNPTCRARVDENKKAIPLPVDENMNLKVDNSMKTKIAAWIKENNYREDEDEDDEDENIIFFRKSKMQIKSARIEKLYKDGTTPKPSPEQKLSNRTQTRPRPLLSD